MCVEKASDSGTFFCSHLMPFVIKSQGTHTVKSLPLNLDHLRQHKRQLMRAVKINYAHTLAIYGSLFPSWILRIVGNSCILHTKLEIDFRLAI